jgi:hypothetical protein
VELLLLDLDGAPANLELLEVRNGALNVLQARRKCEMPLLSPVPGSPFGAQVN